MKCIPSDTSTEVAQFTATLQMGSAAVSGHSQGAEHRLLLPSLTGAAVVVHVLGAKPDLTPAAHQPPACRHDPRLP